MVELPTEYEPLKGRASKKSMAFRPGDAREAKIASAPETRFPRPSRFRYPISPEAFQALKDGAAGMKDAVSPQARTLMDRASPSFPGKRVAAAAPAPSKFVAGFAGIPATGWVPYDCATAVGKQHVLCAVNSTVAAFARNGTPAFQTKLSDWFKNVVPGEATVFDPRLLYDRVADKYVLVAGAYNPNTKQSSILISVSQTGDPTGSWWSNALDATVDGTTPTNNWADYPGLGQDATAIYLTANMFQWNDGPFQYAKLRIVPKQSLYSGGTPTFVDFVGMTNEDGSPVFTLQPANDLDPSAEGHAINTIYPTESNPSASQLSVWTVQNPTTNPSLQRQAVSCSSYAIPPHADQKGGAPPLDTGDVRVMNAVLRDGFLWASFTTQHSWEGDATNVAAVFWVQLNNGALVQEGIFGASGVHYFYPAILPVASEDCLLVFSRSSPNDYATLCATGRKKADPQGTFGPSSVIKSGSASYTGLDGSGRNRWGDYSAVSPDPGDGSSGWIYGGYASGANQWGTWVSSGKP